MTPRKECSLGRTGLMKMRFHKNCDNVYETCKSSSQAKSQQGGRDISTNSHPKPKKLSAIDNLLREGNQFLSMDWQRVHQSHPKEGPMLKSSWLTQIRYHFLFPCVFCFCLFKTEQEHEIGWGRRWRGMWEELGKGKEYDQYVLYEILKE